MRKKYLLVFLCFIIAIAAYHKCSTTIKLGFFETPDKLEIISPQNQDYLAELDAQMTRFPEGSQNYKDFYEAISNYHYPVIEDQVLITNFFTEIANLKAQEVKKVNLRNKEWVILKFEDKRIAVLKNRNIFILGPKILEIDKDIFQGKAYKSKLSKDLINDLFSSIKIEQYLPDKFRSYQDKKIIAASSFELSPQLQTVYEQFSTSKNDELLRKLEPIDIFSLYFHSITIQDSETQYALLNMDHTPPKYTFTAEDLKSPEVRKVNKRFLQKYTKNVKSIEQIIVSENQAYILIKYNNFDENGGFTWATISKTNTGIWKAGFA